MLALALAKKHVALCVIAATQLAWSCMSRQLFLLEGRKRGLDSDQQELPVIAMTPPKQNENKFDHMNKLQINPLFWILMLVLALAKKLAALCVIAAAQLAGSCMSRQLFLLEGRKHGLDSDYQKLIRATFLLSNPTSHQRS